MRHELEPSVPESLLVSLGNRNQFADRLGKAFRARRGTPHGKSGVKLEMLTTEAHGGRKRWKVKNAPRSEDRAEGKGFSIEKGKSVAA